MLTKGKATLKKSLFPFDRVGENIVTRAAGNSFFFPKYFFLYDNPWVMPSVMLKTV